MQLFQNKMAANPQCSELWINLTNALKQSDLTALKGMKEWLRWSLLDILIVLLIIKASTL